MNSFRTRRRLLGAAATASIALPLGAMAPRMFGTTGIDAPVPRPDDAHLCQVATEPVPAVTGPLKSLRLTWNANAICTVGVPVADKNGYFANHGLQVELINFGGSTDQLLEAIATGKADAGVGMALRWLKPLEQGFDVKITTAIHGGCMRLFTNSVSGIKDIAGLRGKTVGVSDLAAPDKNFFSIVAAKQGIDPNRDIEWRAYPADMLGVALQRGEIQVISLGDPLGWMLRDRDHLVELANNLDGEYAHMACCVLGVRGSLIRNDRPTAVALTAALGDAQEFVAAHPDEAAAIFAPYSKAPVEQLAAMLRSHTHHHHPMGDVLKAELAVYAQDLKLVQVLKPGTDPQKFADKIYANTVS
jgi:NitT/TauT family transport system substrate-binding protein